MKTRGCRIIHSAIAALIGVLQLTACGDTGQEPITRRPSTVTVSPATAELTALRDTVQLTAQVLDQHGQVMAGASVTWTSSDVAVAAVDSRGLVAAWGNGVATITATAGQASGSAAVTVAQRVSVVAVTPAADTVAELDTLQLVAEARDANGHAVAGAQYTWMSTDTSVAVVSDSGLVTGAVPGDVEITATSSGVVGRAALVVEAAVPATVTVTPDSVDLPALADTVRMAVEVRDQIGRVMADQAVAWASGDTSVATVDSAGLVAAVANGRATITATAGSVTGSAAVYVMQLTQSVIVTPSSDTVPPGDTARLSAVGIDENGYAIDSAAFVWMSSNTSVAVVNPSGLVQGVGEGVATITATASGVQGTAEITVMNLDRDVLAVIYEATNGPNWFRNEGWLWDVPLERWEGVSTDEWGRVTRLELGGNNLEGPIPPELGELSRLTYLDFSGNILTGPVPPELGKLARLTHLDLVFDRVPSPIPPELWELTNLEHLSLWGPMGPISSGIGKLTELRSLSLYPVSGGPIPSEIGNLTELRSIRIAGALEGPIPSEIGNLRELRSLSLTGAAEGGAVTGPIPSEIGNLAKLERLYLSDNDLTGRVPPELGSLTKLQVLDLRGNSLTEIAPELGGLPELKSLNLSGNRLTEIAPELGHLIPLKFLSLASNNMMGSIPPELGTHRLA